MPTTRCPHCHSLHILYRHADYLCAECMETFVPRGEAMPSVPCPSCDSDNTSSRASPTRNHSYECNDCGETFGPPSHDPVDHPQHYTSHQSGIECIEICRELGFDLGNAFKYVWRHELKDKVQALEKALWYLGDAWDRRPPPIDPWVIDKMARVLVHERDADKGLSLYYIMRAVCYPSEYKASLQKAHETIRRMIDVYTQSS